MSGTPSGRLAVLALVALGVVLAVVGAIYGPRPGERPPAAPARPPAEPTDAEGDLRAAEALAAEAEDLWPAVPELVPRLEDWLARARPLAARLPDYRAALAARPPAAPGPPAPRRGPGRREPSAPRERDPVARAARALEALAAADAGGGASIAAVEGRLEFAATIRRRSLEEPRTAWQQAIDSIGRSPIYGGLRVVPRLGLVPLGSDPASGLWEFAVLASGAAPARGPDGRIRLGPDDAIVLVLLPGGSLREGSPPDEAGRSANEGPARDAAVGAFFLSKFEMTQAQWTRAMGSNPSHFTGDPLRPVEQVSWEECGRALRRLGLALPAETQWEYAARAGTTTPWSTGADPAALADAANLRPIAKSGAPAVTTPVGRYRANPFGLHDAHGNVWEWCRDSYDPRGDLLAVDPEEGDRRALAAESFRVYRGGGVLDPPSGARSAVRNHASPGFHYSLLGVRPALDPGAD